ncbi:MAG: serine/threonine protein kinase, partial [Planctomycetales bacterium]|nr:serine/threonine protein kinase [Planctomycetales bacterium]
MKRPEPPARPSNPSEFQDADVTFDRLLDEIGDRINRHQAVDLEQYTREHPELADRLRKAVTGLMLVAECAPNLSDTPETSLPTDRTLGDYRLMRQIGSGGMGVVYEAEQLSLGRRVALKVLPFAAVLDQRQLTRFQNEARAAATLDHPHIVSVYGVGQERGVYYYAMQLIEGQSLAQVIAQRLHDEEAEVASRGADLAPATAPDQSTLRAGATTTLGSHDESAYLRDVARVAAEAAEALDYAHQQGVVHRDIKPANLLVDRSGRLYVTDFGLARIDANPSITATGNVIGTMRYMSPEQALAKRDVVDHRTDVFSLGATLYELITLRPARDGEARHDVVRQIGAETPPAPRSLCPRIP